MAANNRNVSWDLQSETQPEGIKTNTEKNGNLEVNISGLVVDTDPRRTDEVSAALAGLDGIVALELIMPNRIAIVIEAGTVNMELGVCRLINEIPGVRGVYLAYHNFENTLGDDGVWEGGSLKDQKHKNPITWG